MSQRTEQRAQYGQVLQSSSIVGGAELAKLGIRVLRMKVVAVLLGPSGLGLLSVFQSVMDVANTVTGMGIRNSAVRQIAEAAGTDDSERTARIAAVVRVVSLLTGSAGVLLLCLFAGMISEQTFGTREYTWHLRMLSVAVLFATVSAGQIALIQGQRRIGDLARNNLYAALFGALVSIIFFWFLGIEGIVPSLVALAVISTLISFHYSRRLNVSRVRLPLNEFLPIARSLLTLGLAFLWTAMLATLVTYATRAIVTRDFGLHAAGVYAAAFGLSGLFVQFILQAMSADFYPRLTAVAADNQQINRLINEQTEIGLLLAFPGLMATLALAPMLIELFYNDQFTEASDLLRWFVIGCIGRVVAWPMGYSLIAKGRTWSFAITESLTHFVHLGMIVAGIHLFGLVGVAIAFAAVYAFYGVVLYGLNRALTGFCWTTSVLLLLVWMVPLAVVVFLQAAWFSTTTSTLIGVLATACAGWICLRQIAMRVGPEHRICRLVHAFPAGRFLLPLSTFER